MKYKCFLLTTKHRADRVAAHKATYPRREFDHFTARTAEFRNPLNRYKPRRAVLNMEPRIEADVQIRRYKVEIVRDQYRTELASQSISDTLASTNCWIQSVRECRKQRVSLLMFP